MTLVVNFFAGSGAGKSALAAHTFALLKWQGVNAELVTEYAKELVWEKSYHRLDDQKTLFEMQRRRIRRLIGNVDVAVVDSPLLLSLVYGKDESPEWRNWVLFEHDMLNSLNFFVIRDESKYEPHRNPEKNLPRSIRLDSEIKEMLNYQGYQYTNIEAGPNKAASVVVPLVLRDLYLLKAPVVE